MKSCRLGHSAAFFFLPGLFFFVAASVRFPALTDSLNVLPAVKAGRLEGGKSSSAPVDGFLPLRAARDRFAKVPKPRRRTELPRMTSSMIVSKTAGKHHASAGSKDFTELYPSNKQVCFVCPEAGSEQSSKAPSLPALTAESADTFVSNLPCATMVSTSCALLTGVSAFFVEAFVAMQRAPAARLS